MHSRIPQLLDFCLEEETKYVIMLHTGLHERIFSPPC
jgi:hypothetical protein